MKTYTLFLVLIFSFISLHAQDIILPKEIQELHRRRLTFKLDPDFLDAALKSHEEIFQMNLPGKVYSGLCVKYADLLAVSGNLEKAVIYYDLAFSFKRITAEQFGYPYRAEYFEKDTLLYNQKKKEYYEKSNYYTPQELELLIEVREIFAVDQFARHYDWG